MSNGELITEGTTRRCVPLSQGALSPDLRVNYEFGLVLGVDEFRQEQRYHLENNYLHHRSLHGYGTVCGLRVTLDDREELQVQVATGAGVDQAGRTFIVRNPQCASLTAWLEQQDAPGEVDEVYVVARYDECLDALVPIRGEPCSSGEEYHAASRIRRAFQLALQTAPPAMLAWDAVQRLAALMSRVALVPGLPEEDSDELVIVKLVRLLLQERAFEREFDVRLAEAEEEGISRWRFLRLPEADARHALDRILTVWVTEICPQLVPDPVDPEDDADKGILLARLERAEEDDEDAVAGWRVVDEGRPYLLSTQLIQSLLFLGGAPAEPEMRTIDELISVDTFAHGQARGQLGLRLWFHLDSAVTLPADAVEVELIWPEGPETLPIRDPRDVSGDGDQQVWEIMQAAQGSRLRDGYMVEIRLRTDRMEVDGRALSDVLRGEEEAYVGYDGENTLTTYYVIDAPPEDIDEEELRIVPFVTITPIEIETPAMISYELWFHMDLRIEGETELGRLNNLSGENLRVFTEVESERLGPVTIPENEIEHVSPNVYEIWTDARNLGDDATMRYVCFAFLIESDLRIVNEQDNLNLTLNEYMEKFRVRFDGYYSDYVTSEGDEVPAIVVYVRLPRDMELT